MSPDTTLPAEPSGESPSHPAEAPESKRLPLSGRSTKGLKPGQMIDVTQDLLG